jgi:hypothetical protein
MQTPGGLAYARLNTDQLTAEQRRAVEDVMPRRRWSDLNEGTRSLLITTAVADGALRIAALIDIKRRPASQIRSRERVWAAVVVLVNSAGVAPILILHLRAASAALI